MVGRVVCPVRPHYLSFMRIRSHLVSALIGCALSFTRSHNCLPVQSTLFADSTAISGGYFAMTLRYTNISDNNVALIGMGAGMVIDHKLNIGLAGA